MRPSDVDVVRESLRLARVDECAIRDLTESFDKSDDEEYGALGRVRSALKELGPERRCV